MESEDKENILKDTRETNYMQKNKDSKRHLFRNYTDYYRLKSVCQKNTDEWEIKAFSVKQNENKCHHHHYCDQYHYQQQNREFITCRAALKRY